MAAPLALQAQSVEPKLAGRTVAVENIKVENTNQTMVIDLDLNMDSLKLKADMRLVFTPIITNNTEERRMPQIIVNGRRQDISYQRGGHKDFPADVLAVRRKNNTEQTLHYSAVLPYEDWMKNSNVIVAEDLCGCGDVKDQNTVELKLSLIHISEPTRPY